MSAQKKMKPNARSNMALIQTGPALNAKNRNRETSIPGLIIF
jgi:hypothetical protein